uniref:FAM194 C-terminal domain-containing protein n=1 Tax=Heliothis virescens TaxID=7102 RepID=A0A2A4JKG7_HELVI
MKHVKENEVIGVCEHCKRAGLMKIPCQRCNYAVSKFLSLYDKKLEEKQQRYKLWLCKLRRLIKSIIASDENVIPHRVQDPELERILHELEVPLKIRRPKIDAFPDLDQEQLTSLSESKELLEELLLKLKFKDDIAHVTSDSYLYPSPSKEMCLCKFIKEGYHEGTIPHGTMLSVKPIEGRRRLLSYQEYCNNLVERLLDLSKALKLGVPVNKRVVQEILETLNEVGNKGLEPIITAKLIKQLKDLQSALPHDISKELSKDGIQDLIKDLKNLQIKDRSRLSDEDLYKSLNEKLLLLKKTLPRDIHENKELNQEIHESLNEVMRKGLTTKVIAKLTKQLKDLHQILPQDIYKSISKNGVQELIDDLNNFLVIAASKNLNKDLLRLLVDVSDMITQELSKKINEYPRRDKPSEIVQEGLSPGQENLPKPEMTIVLHKKDEEDKTQTLPSVQSEKSIEGLPKVENKYSLHGLPKEKSSKIKIPSLGKTSSKQIAHGMTPRPYTPSEDETQVVLKDQSKDAKSMQGLTDVQSKQSAYELPGAQSGVDTRDSLETKGKKGAQDLSRGMTKKSLQGLAKVQSKQSTQGLPRPYSGADTYDSLESEGKEGAKDLSKDLSKKSMQGLTKVQSKHSTHGLPRPHSGADTRDSLGRKGKERAQDLSRGLSKKSMQGLIKVRSKQSTQGIPRPYSEADTSDSLESKGKEGAQDLSRGLSKKSTQGFTDVQSKDSTQGIPRPYSEADTGDSLETQSEESAKDLTASPSKKKKKGESMQHLSKAPSDISKAEKRQLSKRGSKKSMHGLLKSQSKISTVKLPKVPDTLKLTKAESKKSMLAIFKGESVKSMPSILKIGTTVSSHSLPVVETEHELIPEKPQLSLEPKLSRAQIKKSLLSVPLRTPRSKVHLSGSEEGKSSTLIKDGKRSLASVQSKDDTHDLFKVSEKDLAQKIQKKESRDKDLHKTSEKELKHATIAKNQIELAPSLSKKGMVHKAKVDREPEASQSDKSSIDFSIKVMQKLTDLNQALASKSLDKNLVQELAKNINEALGETSPDLLNNIIQELTNLCVPAMEGIPKTSNIEKIQQLIKNASTALGRGLSDDENKRTIKSLLNDLSTTFIKDKEQSKKLEQGTAKDSSRYLKPPSKRDLRIIRAMKAAEANKIDKATEIDNKLGTKNGENVGINAESAPEDISPKKGLKSKKSPAGKVVETDKTSDRPGKKSVEEDRRTGKTKLELASKKGKIKKKIGGDDDSLGTTEKKLKGTSPKGAKAKKQSDEEKLTGKSKSELPGKKGKIKHKESDEDSFSDTVKKILKHQTSKMLKSSRTRLELAAKKGLIKYDFGSDDDSLDFEVSDDEIKKGSPEGAKPKKGKENKPSKGGAKKSRRLKSTSKQNVSTIELKKPKQMSESALRRLLSSNRLNAARYAAYMEKVRAKEKEMEKRRLRELQLRNMPKIKPKKVIKLPDTPEETISSILECEVKRLKHPTSMIKGDTIVPYNPRYKDYNKIELKKEPEPLLFKTELELGSDHTALKPEYEPGIDYEAMFRDGVMRYRLSSREFIENGWTVLPTKKIMRRMNIYKMKPANPKHDWFELHKHKGELFYDTGERLAYIKTNGRGHWFYKNGTVALDYYNAQEINIGQRYVVYSSGMDLEGTGKIKPRTILALFDVLGNGVVYDHYGNVRLKYNQTEGLLLDSKVGPPGRWKWHSLNDPPVLQQVFINEKEHDRRLERATRADRAQEGFDFVRQVDPEMISIELDNIAKEKRSSLMKKFKPFKIRMKAVKLNNNFSLKILDQSSIILRFRDGATSMKLHLGMHLISNEIIDTDTSDMSDVSTPYDKHPAKTASLENIHTILKTVRSGKFRLPLEQTVDN